MSPAVPDPSFAKGGASGDPTVSSATPAKAPQNITVDVAVAGSGFDQGSRAVWAIDGDTTFATTKVKTNSTTYVSAKKLIANISIGGDASVDLYDVQVVTLSGRKGIGIELFAVTGLVDLGPARDSSVSVAYDINSTGTVVGYTIDNPFFQGKQHATRWSPAGGTWAATDLTAQLGGSLVSSAYAVNAAADVVGVMRVPSGTAHAFLLSATGVMTDLGVLPGQTYSLAWDVNAIGEVVGSSYNIINPLPTIHRPFYWSQASGMVALPMFGNDTTATAEARAINDNGTIVGDAWDPVRSERRAVRWQKVEGVWVIAALPSSGWAIAKAITNSGDVAGVGCEGPLTCQGHALFWPAGGPPVDLGTLGGATSEANGLNSAGRVVGYSLTSRGYGRAFSWTLAGGMTDLGALGGERVAASAQSVNDFGLIAGLSTAAATGSTAAQYHGTLWRFP